MTLFRSVSLIGSLILTVAAPAGALSVVEIASGFNAPMFAAAPPGDDRLFVVERDGRIWILDDGVVSAEPYLDIRARVDTTGEGGLLGVAFPDDFTFTAGERFFVYYTGPGSGGNELESILSSFPNDATTPTLLADAGAETVVFQTDQPEGNHNGGTIAVRDGFLYLGLGDGGGSFDPEESAQDPSSPLGKILRFDLSEEPPLSPEIWASGLRNPFRFSFDSETGDLYIGDVGQGELEEIDVEPFDSSGGRNYGWDVLEGTNCLGPSAGEPECDDPSLVPPVFEYAHGSDPCSGSVTGGAVYRGSAMPSETGRYFFADFCKDRLFSLEWDGADGVVGDVVELTEELAPENGNYGGIVAMVPDADDELVIVDVSGRLYRVVPEPGAALQTLVMLFGLHAVGRARRGRNAA